MADPTNASFETAGAAAGQASGWTEAQSTGGEDTAVFDTGATGDRPFEDFETQFQEPESALATYNEVSIDDFADGTLDDAEFDGANPVEQFESKFLEPASGSGPPWNDASETDFGSITSEFAEFDSATVQHEDFESGFIEPETSGTQANSEEYEDAPGAAAPPTPATASPALFNSGSDDHEDFDDATGWGTSDDLAPTVSSQASFTGPANQESYDTWTSTMIW
jgi:hypothetical protein